VIEAIEIKLIEAIETETEKAVGGTEEIEGIVWIVEIVIEIKIVKDAEVVQETEDITAIVRIKIDLRDMNHTIVINHQEKRNL